MSALSAYVPTIDSCKVSIMAFCHDLRLAITSIPNADKIFLLSDLNTYVRRDHNTLGALEKLGLGIMKSNGVCFPQLCTEFKLIICNTVFHPE